MGKSVFLMGEFLCLASTKFTLVTWIGSLSLATLLTSCICGGIRISSRSVNSRTAYGILASTLKYRLGY